MDFQYIPKVENSKFYLENAFSSARKRTGEFKIRGRLDKLQKKKRVELSRLDIVRAKLNNNLMKVLTAFPSISVLPRFYIELIKTLLDYPRLKKSFGALNWAVKKIDFFHKTYIRKIKGSKDLGVLGRHKKEFYGRVSSVVKQIDSELKYLENCRKTMRTFPVIKDNIKTVVIVGFPNVGKTTMMYKLTGSKPEINAFPFTTKNINVAYIKEDDKDVQVLDVPGALDRFGKMNAIEMQAMLAIDYLADLIVYIFDLTEPYPLDQQMKLYEKIKSSGKNMLVYVSKTDITEKSKIEQFKLEALTNPADLKKKIISVL